MGTLEIGHKVERLGSSKDYTTGRKGTIVEINGERCRVRWTEESTGAPITTMGAKPQNGVRTWVNQKFLRKVD